MRHRAEQLPLGLGEGGRRGEDGAVAMLHAVAVRALGVGGEEGVVPGLEGREVAVDGAGLTHDLLDAGGEAVGFGLGAVMAQGHADRRLRRRRGRAHPDLERPQHLRPELDRAVEQVGEVRRREHQRIVGGVELRGHRPGDVGRRHERQPGGPRLEGLRPHQRGRQVEVRLRGVHARVGAVDAVGEQAIADADGAAVILDAPDVQAWPGRRQRPAGAVADLQLENVLRELVQRVAAGRAAAHVDLERIRRDVAEHHLDVDDVPHVVGE